MRAGADAARLPSVVRARGCPRRVRVLIAERMVAEHEHGPLLFQDPHFALLQQIAYELWLGPPAGMQPAGRVPGRFVSLEQLSAWCGAEDDRLVVTVRVHVGEQHLTGL